MITDFFTWKKCCRQYSKDKGKNEFAMLSSLFPDLSADCAATNILKSRRNKQLFLKYYTWINITVKRISIHNNVM